MRDIRDTSRIVITEEERVVFETALEKGYLGVHDDGTAWMRRSYRNIAEGGKVVHIKEPLDLDGGTIVEAMDIPGGLTDGALKFLRERSGWQHPDVKDQMSSGKER